MRKPMSKRERLEATLAGQPVDRVAVALWRHWPVDDQRGDSLARASITFQRTFDFDLIKVSPSSNYCIAGYGAASTWTGNLEGTRDWGRRVIQSPEDWTKLKPLDPASGLQGEILEANRHLQAEFGTDVPRIQTIFNPLAQAKNLAGERLLSDIRQHPDAVREGLGTITESIINFITTLKPTGLDGIFLALQHATYDLLTEAEYRDICRPFDMEIMEAVNDLWLNMLHLHGENVMFDVALEYPVQIINWHDVETPPSLGEARHRTNKTLCGGIRQWETMMCGDPAQVEAEARTAIAATEGRRFILGTGCVTPIVAPAGNMLAARQVVDEIKV